jgi:2'-5' RNA ligase
VRLFVAIRPPPEVVDALAALPRPEAKPVRWTSPDQWHVTLRFFGNVDDAAPITSALTGALRDVAPLPVTIGPRAGLLGRQVVYVPVTGLTDIASTLVEATKAFGDPPSTRRFRGHLTLARMKGGFVDLASLALEGSWTVRDIELIRSHLGRGGARYETVERFELRAQAASSL